MKNQFDIPVNLDDLLAESSVRQQVIGSWGFHSNINFASMKPEESNVWFFEQTFNFLRAFFGLVVPDNLEISTYNGAQQIKRENLNQMTFLDEYMLILKNLKEHIWVSRLNLNIVGFLRTDFNPDVSVRLQIQEPASFVVWGGPDESGFQSFQVGYRLFAEQNIEGEHNMLWSMNQPLLQKGLSKWEKQSHHKIEVVQSNSDDLPLYRHGFSKPATRKPKPKPVETGPVEDFFPDLDDLTIK
ncbi:MAG: hypothetical protein COV43_04975 [Deltaproteobacteria bacterium CG11_big_fil_rev_8_21_14_0_20_42_23]|nr:MAG: hypothetical protein COV43_04975 [Deltaproteobacteria bacterium CG11_big_fil_rev_8_21_14_0_20_42_23]PJC65128.1 MAG: hypothetical protein CO021_01365 [Deltaproteobacteria bacterium CG_4_9_14_0_2_um_filter_42_21]